MLDNITIQSCSNNTAADIWKQKVPNPGVVRNV